MKIACVAHRLDYVLSEGHHRSRDLHYVIFRGTNDEKFLASILPKKRIIWGELKKSHSIQEVSDAWLMKNSDLPAVLKREKISHFILSHQGDASLERWAKKVNIALIGPTSKITNTLENKGWFQNFLEKANLPTPPSIVCRGKDIKKATHLFPCVIQDLDSFGSFGTYFNVNQERLLKMTKNAQIHPSKRYLVRKKLSGKTFGISLVVGPRGSSLSALRLQCFYEKSARRILFAGVQWVPTRALSPKLTKSIESIFSSMEKELRQRKLFGLFNFDLIVNNRNEVFVLECNPRLSSATAQIEAKGDLMNPKLPVDHIFYWDTVTNGAKRLSLPQSNFSGALLDVLPLKPVKVKNEGICNFYSMTLAKTKKALLPQNERLSFTNNLLVHGSLIKGSSIGPHETIAAIVANTPLFSINGKLNRLGLLLRSLVIKSI